MDIFDVLGDWGGRQVSAFRRPETQRKDLRAVTILTKLTLIADLSTK
jgi:hypothetical protein